MWLHASLLSCPGRGELVCISPLFLELLSDTILGPYDCVRMALLLYVKLEFTFLSIFPLLVDVRHPRFLVLALAHSWYFYL
jgi:hypothetical protein